MVAQPHDVERIAAALGEAVAIPYAPPHVYPMSAPRFDTQPRLERPRPHATTLGMYLHVPFCNYACNFCFYAMRAGASEAQMERYVRAAARELAWIEPGTRLAQLYVGGGTPTALPAPLLDELLGAALERMTGTGEQVHTVETSPESASPEHLAVLAARGIGRVSMGIQTFDDAVLQAVHRRHSAAQALAACELLVASGLRVNVDLIYGLPGQTEAIFRADFERLVDAGVHSICVYNLRLNERTPVVRQIGRDERLELGRLVRWRAFVAEVAEAAGFEQERWHVYARPSAGRFEDRTGQGEQLGVGQSARSRLGGVLYRNHDQLGPYLERVEAGESPVEEVLIFRDEDRALRHVTTTLAVGKPLARAAFAAAIGVPFDEVYGPAVRRLVDGGLLDDHGDAVELTRDGRLVYDLVTLAFYPEHVRAWLNERHRSAMERFGLTA